MKKTKFILFYLSCTMGVFGQNASELSSVKFFMANQSVIGDTVYFNVKWKKSSKEESTYYRIIKEIGSKYTIEDYSNNGLPIEKGEYSSTKKKTKNGHVLTYGENGELLSDYFYEDDVLNGDAFLFHKNGNLKMKMLFKNNVKTGVFQEYDQNGKPLYVWTYAENAAISAKRSSNDSLPKEEDEVYTVYEESPEFPGGNGELAKFVEKNLKNVNGLVGTVHIMFVVEKDGTTDRVAIMKDVCSGCGEEAVRVILSMPKWEPGKQKGNAVRCIFMLPITFKLN